MAEVLPFRSTGDDTAQRALALDVRSSCIVEAPAGSGKTGLLVQRYLRLLAQPEVTQPEEVLAITFTNKATAELLARVLSHLQSAHQNIPLIPTASPFDHLTRTLSLSVIDRSATLDWDLLAQPQRLNIRSIDSVCAVIANSLPILSGSGGDRQPIPNADALYHAAARRTLLELGGPDQVLTDSLSLLLAHRDANLADCESLLAEMLQKRDQWARLVPLEAAQLDDATLDTETRPRLERALEQIVCTSLSRALDAMPAHLLHDLTAFAHRNSTLPPFKLDTSPISFCANLHLPPQAIAAHLDHWTAIISLLLKKDGDWRKRASRSDLGFDLPKSEQTWLEQLLPTIQTDDLNEALNAVRNLPPAAYPDDQWRVVKALFRILRHALAELKLLFAERSECDFTEIALAAREALRSGDEALDAALTAGGHLRHLLVDEMQDTSSGQYDLISLLTRSFDGATQTLFLVGDPKQSIYLFREARVECFLRTLDAQRLGEIPLRTLRLTANFRSQAELVSRFNADFSRLFPPPNDPSLRGGDAVDVPFVAATPTRPKTFDPAVHWHTSVLEEEIFDPVLGPNANHRAYEALTIRRQIEQRLALPLPSNRSEPWSIAVLGRNRNHLSAIIAELKIDRDHGPIPFRAVDLDALDELPEVLDALALTRALLHPSDRIAWLAVLHAPWCGLGLADLLALTGEGTTADTHATVAELVEARAHLLSPTGQQFLNRIWPTLQTAVTTLGRTLLSTHIERAWRSLGGDAMLPPNRQTNVLRFLDVLRDLEADSPMIDLSTLTTRLNRLFAEPASGPTVVELMTIHKAKGLEWDMVLVPALERGSGDDSTPLLNWMEFDGLTRADGEPEPTIILAPIHARGGKAGQLTKWLSGLRRRRDKAERKRLFYVAATRAREELHLFAAVERNQSGLSHGTHTSLLNAIWPTAAPYFETLQSNVISFPQTAPIDDFRYEDDLVLAASAETATTLASTPHAPTIQQLPLTFNPLDRFQTAAANRLTYLPSSALPQSPAFDRPEGSFAVRAFGNVVHRYLQLLSDRLAHVTKNAGAPFIEQHLARWVGSQKPDSQSSSPETSENRKSPSESLLTELPQWQSRLLASLRGEGLPPQQALRESQRALHALTSALSDPTGLWILSPHPQATSESIISTQLRSLRADRTFLAGPTPLSAADTHIWIVDFKTAQQGSRSDAEFEQSELDKYRAQLKAYAAIRSQLPDGNRPIRLGLYYPLVPRLIYWDASPGSAIGDLPT